MPCQHNSNVLGGYFNYGTDWKSILPNRAVSGNNTVLLRSILSNITVTIRLNTIEKCYKITDVNRGAYNASTMGKLKKHNRKGV